MHRRGFLKFLSAGVAGLALDQAIPFNRVWSFPKKIVIPKFITGQIGRCYGFDYLEEEFAKPFKIDTTIRVRLPQRFVVRDYIGDLSMPKQYEDVTILEDGKISIS